MPKVTKPFQFIYPLRKKSIKWVDGNLKEVSETVAELSTLCTGTFDPSASPMDPEDRYRVSVDGVFHNGHDITEVVHYFDHMDDVAEAATRAFAKLIEKLNELEGLSNG